MAAAATAPTIRSIRFEVSGEIAKGVHLGSDRFVDVINLDRFERTLRLYENRGSGFRDVEILSTGGSTITDVVTGDFDGDLEAEVLFGRAGRRDGLFDRDAQGRWSDVGEKSVPDWERNTAGLASGDFDNDGDLDYAALKRQRDVDGVDVVTYLNRGDGSFREGPRFFDPEIEGRSDYMISGDFNRDGALDLLLTTSASIGDGESSRDGVYVYLEGKAPARNNWLSVELRGTVSETGGLGARVFVTTEDGATRVLEQDGGVHYTAQNATDLHFGLGRDDVADVRIVWPDGYEQTIAGVSANQHVVLVEKRAVKFAGLLVGTDAANALRGSESAELLRGKGGDDVLSGRRGSDAMYGGNGDDRLFGGSGADVLNGGRGSDVMKGGAGADRFVFRAMDGRDVIKGFDSGVDVVDLSRMDANALRPGAQALDYIGRAGFGSVAGQLRARGGRDRRRCRWRRAGRRPDRTHGRREPRGLRPDPVRSPRSCLAGAGAGNLTPRDLPTIEARVRTRIP